MRLLNVHTLQLETRKTEPYAILSHTWADEEVTFEDLGTDYVTQNAGYQKILRTCAQAKRDGYQYMWIDTYCIDKRSSAELSESINSMFR
jgi:Heterokaryon incompatibility protein (HET)